MIELERHSVNGHCEIGLTKEANSDIFSGIEKLIAKVFGITYPQKIDGNHQKYWDFNYQNHDFTLHFESQLGISIYLNESFSESGDNLLMTIAKMIATKFNEMLGK